jgi:hypothetical protein
MFCRFGSVEESRPVAATAWLPLGRAPLDRQAELPEQDLLQLFGGVEVEARARGRVRLALELDEPPGDLVALPAQHVRVDQHAQVLHVEQHRDERLLYLLVQRAEPRQLLELRPQRAVQAERHVGVFRGVLGGLLERHLVERELLRAFSGDVLVVDRLDPEVS